MYKTIDEIPADLRWLAENVHEWPENNQIMCDGYTARCLTGQKKASSIRKNGGHDVFWRNKTQYMAARDLISGRPGWDEAPDGAKILAQEDTGEWVFGTYQNANPAGGIWLGEGFGHWFQDRKTQGKVLGDWRDTLERRPDDLGNHLLDGDAPATFRVLNQPLVSTTVRELRINHDDGHIDVTALPDGGGVLLVDDQGGEARIPNLAALDATAAAVRRILGGES